MSRREPEGRHLPVKGYEHEYDVYEDGKVLSKLTDMWLTPNVDSKGYLYVNLCKDGKRKSHRVHILVATAFVPNPDNLPVVDHKDTNKQNPHYTNLEWVTYSENTRRAHETGCFKTTNAIKIVRGDGVEYQSLTEAAEKTGISKGAISKALNGHRPTAGGYVWYAKKEDVQNEHED